MTWLGDTAPMNRERWALFIRAPLSLSAPFGDPRASGLAIPPQAAPRTPAEELLCRALASGGDSLWTDFEAFSPLLQSIVFVSVCKGCL